MSISKLRGVLYLFGRVLGDLQAVRKARRQRSLDPVLRRVQRRIAGKIVGRLMRRI